MPTSRAPVSPCPVPSCHGAEMPGLLDAPASLAKKDLQYTDSTLISSNGHVKKARTGFHALDIDSVPLG